MEKDERHVATRKGSGLQLDPLRQVAAAEVPHNGHLHGKEVPKDYLLAVQPDLRFHPEVDKIKGSFPVFSIIKALAFTFVDFTDTPTLLKSLKIGDAPE